jgi:tetratricopeptide (TPR) repeat protein
LAVSAASTEVLDTLNDAGLLEIDASSRYTLHQSIADYAKVQPDDENVSWRFIEYYKNYMQEHRTNIEGLEVESQNLFSALEMVYALGDHATFVQMTFAMTDFLFYRGLYDQAKSHLTRAYEALQTSGDMEVIATCLHYLGMVAQKQGEYQQATASYEKGLLLAREANQQEQICAMLADLGWVNTKRGRYEQAQVYAQEGQTLARQINDAEHLCQILATSGVIMDVQGDYIQAEKYYQEGLAIARQLHNQEQECIFLIDLSANADCQDHSSELHRFSQEALACARQLGHLEWQCVTLSNLSGYYELAEEYESARAYNQQAVQLARQLGHREWLSQTLLNQAGLAIRANDCVQAETIVQEALLLAIQIEKPIYVCNAYRLLGHIALLRQQLDTAADFFTKMLSIVPPGLHALKAESLYRLALVSSAQGEQQAAKELGDAAYTLMVEVGFKRTEEVRQWMENGYQPSLPYLW